MPDRRPPDGGNSHGHYPESSDTNHSTVSSCGSNDPNDDAGTDPSPQSDRPLFRSGTYIIQVPKDQIYRVPNPDDAILAERHRSPATRKGFRSCCCACISVAAIALVLSLVGFVASNFVEQNPPNFQINRLHVKKSTSHPGSRHRHAQLPEFDITLTAQNPNNYTTIHYDRNCNVSLSVNKKTIWGGTCPSFDQSPKGSSRFELELNGSNLALPPEVKTSMNEDGTEASDRPISLSLSLNVTVIMKVASMRTRSNIISVACNVKVDKLAGNTISVLSEHCHTNG